jgi:hypothetical protein
MSGEVEPLVPPDLDLSSYPFMPLLVARLRRSRAWVRARRKPELGFYMLNVWMAAWTECPASSLEDDDDVLADAAMCDPEIWPSVRNEVLTGFVKCSDGRLYHPVLAGEALKSLKIRENWREKKRNQRSRLRGVPGDTQGSLPGVHKMSPTIDTTRRDESLHESAPDETTTKTAARASTGSSSSSSNGVFRNKDEDRKAAGEVVTAFLAARQRHWPNAKPPSTVAAMTSQALLWVEAGASPALCIAIIDKEIAAKVARNDQAPTNVRFVHLSVDEAIKRGKANGASNGHATSETAAEKHARVSAEVARELGEKP